MPLLNYKPQFAILVESGGKRQTIRAQRKYPVKHGDRLYHYTGLRTKASRKLGESDASMVQEITIKNRTVLIDGQSLYLPSIEELARLDGFESVDAFFEFFDASHEAPFRGQLIGWDQIDSHQER